MIFEVLWPRAGGVPECSYSVPGTSGAWIGDAPHRGDEVRHEATPLLRPSGHRMAESVADLIYGQIHLYPSEVHLGLLSGMEALDVVLWNATFAPVQLVGVNSASSAGTTLSGFRPGVLPPTGALKGLLTVLSSGPAQQDTTYTFVTGIGERSLTITASRVLLFPFWPDWSDGLEIDYAFDTVLTRGENGDEQRRPLAKRPLRTLRATIWGDGVNGQRLHHLVQHGKDRVFGVPLWQEALDVTGIDATRQVLMLGRDFSDCWNLTRLCDLIMLHERRSGTFMACSLLSRDPAGRTLSVTAPVSDVFAGGATRLVPLFTGILTSAEPAVVSDGMETWSVEFRELAGAQPALGALPNAPSGTGAYLWPHRPDWSGDGVGGTSSLLRTLRTVRGGVMELGVRRDVAPSTHRQKYLLRERELADLLDRATALRGRWKALLVRDPRQYFTLTRGSTADKAILYVRDNGAKDGFIPNQRLWIALPGGDILLRRLVAVETANVGELALHLSSELGVTVPPASRVGRDYFARLDMDCVAIRHESAGVSGVSCRFAPYRRKADAHRIAPDCGTLRNHSRYHTYTHNLAGARPVARRGVDARRHRTRRTAGQRGRQSRHGDADGVHGYAAHPVSGCTAHPADAGEHL